MDLYEFISAAKEYNNLGGAVISQFEEIIEGEPLEDMNPNALKYIAEWLRNNKDDMGDDAQSLYTRITEFLK